MSDLFFPYSAPSGHELELIHCIRYIARKRSGNSLMVQVTNSITKTMVERSIKVPAWYEPHIRRFLWRHQIFMEVDRRTTLRLKGDMRALIKRYIAYMDAIIKGLLMTARKNAGKDATLRCRLFDLYLIVDYFIGRHEYQLGDAWRLAHPDIILERQDVTHLDWDSHYKSQDEDPIWTGSAFTFDITKVPFGAWQEVANSVATYFNAVDPPATSEVTKGDRVRMGEESRSVPKKKRKLNV